MEAGGATPYVAVVFSAQRRAEPNDGYDEAAVAMRTLAAEQPGYLGFEAATGVDGFEIAVSYWVDEAAAASWKQVSEHRQMQANGRERWYSSYDVRVATVTRQYGHTS